MKAETLTSVFDNGKQNKTQTLAWILNCKSAWNSETTLNIGCDFCDMMLLTPSSEKLMSEMTLVISKGARIKRNKNLNLGFWQSKTEQDSTLTWILNCKSAWNSETNLNIGCDFCDMMLLTPPSDKLIGEKTLVISKGSGIERNKNLNRVL